MAARDDRRKRGCGELVRAGVAVTRWDAARARSQQPQRTYKPVAPVGVAKAADDYVCRNCGHHQCSCAPKQRTFGHLDCLDPVRPDWPWGMNSVARGATHDPGHPSFSLNPEAPFFSPDWAHVARLEAAKDAIARSCAKQQAEFSLQPGLEPWPGTRRCAAAAAAEAEHQAAVGAERAERLLAAEHKTVREWAAQGELQRLAYARAANPLWFEGDDHETHLEQHKRLLLEGLWDGMQQPKPQPPESAGERKSPPSLETIEKFLAENPRHFP